MKRTTIYLPNELKERLERAADAAGVTEAEIVRSAVETELTHRERPALELPLWASRGERTDSARHVDELLAEGFGSQ